jgi:hypothetical protein
MPNEPITIFTNSKSFQVFTNPSFSELSEIGPLVRFAADNKTKNVYVWDFNSGHHADVSIGLKLDDPFNSLDFLKGHAIKIDNSIYEMVGLDFLQSFFCKPVGKERVNCTALFPAACPVRINIPTPMIAPIPIRRKTYTPRKIVRPHPG